MQLGRIGSLVVWSIGLGACLGSSDGAGASTADSDFACVAQPGTCEITQVSCERQVLALTACVRGDPLPPAPPLRVLTQDQFRAELKASAVQHGITPTQWDPALSSLGLVMQGMSSIDASIDESVASVVAYYDNTRKDITVIQPSTPSDPLTQMYVLSHELTHYLQDRAEDLNALRKRMSGSSDNDDAFSALVEGEATVSSTRAYARQVHIAQPGAVSTHGSEVLITSSVGTANLLAEPAAQAQCPTLADLVPASNAGSSMAALYRLLPGRGPLHLVRAGGFEPP